MSVQRIFILWTHPLFQESVRLILNHPTIEWLGSTSDYAGAMDQILSLRPDVILFEERAGDVPAYALAILKLCSWDATVVGLSLADNHLSVYHHERRVVGQVEDLVHLIQGNQER
jgi:DNA-binding NarL/FixJ family response regulator